jgi:hypothetical protein
VPIRRRGRVMGVMVRRMVLVITMVTPHRTSMMAAIMTARASLPVSKKLAVAVVKKKGKIMIKIRDSTVVMVRVIFSMDWFIELLIYSICIYQRLIFIP